MAKVIRLRWSRPDWWVNSLRGTYLSVEDHVEILIGGEDTDVIKPDGTPLLMYRRNVLPREVCQRAFPALCRAAKPTDARGSAAGGVWYQAPGSSTNRSRKILSGIVGYYDRRPPRHPHCRTTAYTARDVKGWASILPLVAAVNGVFRSECPERYASQMDAVKSIDPYWVIRGTAFTTVTVNRNWRTAAHTDKGDLAEGFGVMSVLTRGKYTGGHLGFPKYGIAVDTRDGDVLLSDVHEYHGNTEIVGVEGEYDRLSTVMYFRTGMLKCLSPGAEYARVAR